MVFASRGGQSRRPPAERSRSSSPRPTSATNGACGCRTPLGVKRNLCQRRNSSSPVVNVSGPHLSRSRSVAAAALLLFAAGCTLGSRSSEASPPTSVPPEAPSGSAPPAAWIEANGESHWLGYSTHCWTPDPENGVGRAICADYVTPGCRGINAAPRIALRRGTRARLHLGFPVTEPVELVVFHGAAVGGGAPIHEETLAKSSDPEWTVNHAGPLMFSAKGKQGDASYVACVELSSSA